MALLGLFTTNNVPTSNPPPTQNYTNLRSNTSFTPLLDQVFFIGDGKTGTGSGATQQFHIPAGATKLYFGFADGGKGIVNNYADNTGFFNATLNVAIPTYGVTGSVLSDVNGKAGAGLAGWRVYIDQNKDGQYDSGDPSAVTTTTGSFTFNLAPGTYTVSVELKNGYAIAAPKTYTYTVTVSSKAVTGLTFVVKQVAATL